ncbi:MAG: tetratricopeptide repeat protein [Trueperaceae bacterium]
MNLRHMIALTCWLLLCGWGYAQLSPEAQQALTKGAQAAAQALATYDEQLLDKPLWREAINYGEQAKQLAPESREPYRFLGQVYSTVKWYSRAWDAWNRYLELGGSRNAQTDRYIVEASSWLGNSSFEERSYTETIKFYNALIEIEPDNEEANQHLALSYIALGQPEQAQPYLERLVQISDNPDYKELYETTTRTMTYGIEAVAAFDEGLNLYNSNRKNESLAAFRRATQANNNFAEAYVYAGRASLETGQANEAVTYWKRVLELEPGNSEAQEAIVLAEGQDRYGAEAFTAFQEGLELYEQGRINEAQQRFLTAVAQNPRYEEAFGYLGQIATQREDYEGAVDYYTSALAIAPGNPQYTAGLSRAQQVLADEETKRLAEEQRLAEEKRLAEEQAAREQAEQEQAQQEAAAEAEREAEAQRLVQEQAEQEQAEQEATEQAALEEAEREAEEAAKAERQAEAERIAQEQAATEQAEREAEAAAAEEAAGGNTPSTGGVVVLIDTSYTHQSSDQGGKGAFSFFSSPGGLEGDSSAFASGTIYQRLEVISKPSAQPVSYQLCLVHGDDVSLAPSCSELSRLTFTAPGVYETQQSVTSFSNYGTKNWTRGLSEIILVLKDPNEQSLDNRNSYNSGADIDLSQYYPMEVRYTAILVAEGNTFPGWP